MHTGAALSDYAEDDWLHRRTSKTPNQPTKYVIRHRYSAQDKRSVCPGTGNVHGGMARAILKTASVLLGTKFDEAMQEMFVSVVRGRAIARQWLHIPWQPCEHCGHASTAHIRSNSDIIEEKTAKPTCISACVMENTVPKASPLQHERKVELAPVVLPCLHRDAIQTEHRNWSALTMVTRLSVSLALAVPVGMDRGGPWLTYLVSESSRITYSVGVIGFQIITGSEATSLLTYFPRILSLPCALAQIYLGRLWTTSTLSCSYTAVPFPIAPDMLGFYVALVLSVVCTAQLGYGFPVADGFANLVPAAAPEEKRAFPSRPCFSIIGPTSDTTDLKPAEDKRDIPGRPTCNIVNPTSDTTEVEDVTV
ncbi:hypothetical protein BC835DRAFT_1523573 [Cytidiella melzeri]|nr:hypothetical protein BC835DRAFT_1523573 [Cytidiella melzeri]